MLTLAAITFWPFLLYASAVLFVVGIMIGLSWVLGERHRERDTDKPYESGMPPTGDARLRFSSHFYLIAIFFVIFDLDSVFILVWATSFRELGFTGYIAILVFIGILIAVLIYEIGIKALDFGPSGKSILKNRKKLSE
ncbi:MAG TPA: NADH-quinone oxidoreductase subunit A [Bacteroidales bacterium]|jgi:NADH-quinone oxidoreductase subunit A|nr:NADH-quinone oxidoreductase subunit A [Bacteroidales bacterium]